MSLSSNAEKNLMINADRLWASLKELAKIGPGVAGGNNRQTLTDEDGEARDLLKSWCDQSGLTTTIDAMGSMFAERAGEDPGALPVLIGSHLDTQPTGGKYDGTLGVLAGLEVIRTLNDLNIKTRHPIQLVNWTNEEGCRFSPSMLASGVFAGVYEQSWAYDRIDDKGLKFGDELRRIGWVGEKPVGHVKPHAYFELHIEQGPILERNHKLIGVVTGGQGVVWTRIKLTGKESHTGSTPMEMRHDAGLGAAKITILVNEIACKYSPLAVGTVGFFDIQPNSINIIPGTATVTVDLRSADATILNAMKEQLDDGVRRIANDLGLAVSFEKLSDSSPVSFDQECVATVRRAANGLKYPHMDLISGAGHDAFWINEVAPSAMIMCPCEGGLSHNEAEHITPEWAGAGANVLCRVAIDTAKIVN
jgi:N-carbamoyl-L-amino-acid hydrolase